MRNSRLQQIILTVAVMTATVAASVVPGRWEKVDTLEKGTQIVVELNAGDRLAVRFDKSGPESITILREDDRGLVLRKMDVARVLLPAKRDNRPVWLGAAIGGGAGLGIGLAVASQADETILAVPGAMGAILGGIGAAAGAGIGLALRDDPSEEVIFTSTR